jgi:hypothetical protein
MPNMGDETVSFNSKSKSFWRFIIPLLEIFWLLKPVKRAVDFNLQDDS